MATSNEIIQDELLRHQIDLLRFGKGIRTRIVQLLNRAEPDLQRRLKARLNRIAGLGWDPGSATTKRMVKTAKLIAEINRPTFSEINKLVRGDLVGLAKNETTYISGVLTASLPVVFDPLLPSAAELRGIVFARPFQNETLVQWLARYENNDRRRMMDQIRQGLVFNETPTQISKRIFGTTALNGTDGTRQITRTGALALAQTAISAISNATRQDLYEKNRRIIPRESYVATLDSRTTPICRSLDNNVYPVGKGPIPPVHINCRSIRVPVIDGRQLGSRPATTATDSQLGGLRGPARRREVEKLTGRVPASESYTAWLRKQTAGFQNEVLGPTRGRLFRSGEVDLSGFVDNSGKQFTLRQLYDQDPSTFQSVNIPAPRKTNAPKPKL